MKLHCRKHIQIAQHHYFFAIYTRPLHFTIATAMHIHSSYFFFFLEKITNMHVDTENLKKKIDFAYVIFVLTYLYINIHIC